MRSSFGLACAGAEAPLPLAARELRGERVEALLPEPPELLEPRIDLVERRRVDGVEPPGAIRPDRREPAVAQDLEVLRDRRLRDPELGLDDGGDRPGGVLAFGEELQDPPPDRVAEDVERVHEGNRKGPCLYKSTVKSMSESRRRDHAGAAPPPRPPPGGGQRPAQAGSALGSRTTTAVWRERLRA